MTFVTHSTNHKHNMNVSYTSHKSILDIYKVRDFLRITIEWAMLEDSMNIVILYIKVSMSFLCLNKLLGNALQSTVNFSCEKCKIKKPSDGLNR